jgi:hypothetical protein
VTESHQTSKVDTSGTAKAIVESFNDLGCDFDISEEGLALPGGVRLVTRKYWLSSNWCFDCKITW